ncbi:hypothetical protein ACHQM5_026159 [Ranunculus cassubicifolius]
MSHGECAISQFAPVTPHKGRFNDEIGQKMVNPQEAVDPKEIFSFDKNSSPESSAVNSSEVSVCTSSDSCTLSKLAPLTPNKENERHQNQPSKLLNNFRQENIDHENKESREGDNTDGSNSFEQHYSEASCVINSSPIDTSKKRTESEVDLNKTPQLKPGRKKHRPRVVKDGNQNRTPKSMVTPNNISATERVKRKYVRRQPVQSNRPSEDVLENDSSRQASLKSSTKRALKFGLEDQEQEILGKKLRHQEEDVNVSQSQAIDLYANVDDSYGSMTPEISQAIDLYANIDDSYGSMTPEISQVLDAYSAYISLSSINRQPTRRELIRANLIYLDLTRDGPMAEDEHQKGYFKKKRTLKSGKGRGTLPDHLMQSPFDELAQLSKHMTMSVDHDTISRNDQNVLVLFKGSGKMVPYKKTIKKKKHQPKVALDSESVRVWNLLMGIPSSEYFEGTSEENDKYLEEERNRLRIKVDALIALMHLIQGDRRFSPWYGSIVDSVVGVFLTQNVGDVYSSNAFISLAACFPYKPTSNDENYLKGTNMYVEEPEIKVINQDIVAVNHVEEMEIGKKRELLEIDTKSEGAHLDKQPTCQENMDNTKNAKTPKRKTEKAKEKNEYVDWDNLRREAYTNYGKRERTLETMDSVDWEAVRCAHEDKIADVIKDRGMNRELATKIQAFLNRLVRDHGSIDLEWLRDVPPDKVKDYLLSIYGIGLKSTECVRLLTLQHLAFPVDTNIGRIVVRLGWVPIHQLPDSLQLHLLELYPVMDQIQQYLWPRLCKLDQRTLYELHYQLITFGKVFCTKIKPNCNACPMRADCKHFASAYAWGNFALPGPEEKSSAMDNQKPFTGASPFSLPPPSTSTFIETRVGKNSSEPIIEEPASPEPESTQILETDIEDAFWEDPDEIPTIKLNVQDFALNLHNYMQENMHLQDGDVSVSKALVALHPEAASIPTPKLKNVGRLRTEHLVYELPDSHPLLEKVEKRFIGDVCSYLLAIWTPGETAESVQPPKGCYHSQGSGNLCSDSRCFSCNNVNEANTQIVRGTLLIPCKTAMRGSFPLNGTYFQVNEVFADHESSLNPIDVPRSWLWNLRRRTVYFGTSVSSIFRGQSTDDIQSCFWKGYICVRGFDRTYRAPRPLLARLHFSASKVAATTKAKRGKRT